MRSLLPISYLVSRECGEFHFTRFQAAYFDTPSGKIVIEIIYFYAVDHHSDDLVIVGVGAAHFERPTLAEFDRQATLRPRDDGRGRLVIDRVQQFGKLQLGRIGGAAADKFGVLP